MRKNNYPDEDVLSYENMQDCPLGMAVLHFIIMIIKIDTPPPTISGNLHIGHIFSYCHIDIMARYWKYLKYDVKFPIGFDCNGLPTEKLIKKDQEYSLEKYINKYIDLFETMRFTMDFDNHYKTLDFDKIANNIFFILEKQKIIYKDKKECYFDPIYNTPLSNTEIEEVNGILISEISKKPIIKTEVEHYFLKTVEIKEELLEFIKPIKFYPESKKQILINWIENLKEDWCISRDREYGIKINNTNKVFDTWFCSALTHLFTKTRTPDEYIKNQIRFQSHEIIRSWCFYSIVLSYYINKFPPFKDVIISGWVVDKQGNKFSKSLGNYKDVNKLIEQYGINPIRYWCAYSGIGNDTHFDENVIKIGKRLETKVINAERFFDMNLCTKDTNQYKIEYDFEIEFKTLMNQYDISEAIKYLYNAFFDFCSNDIENCKKNKDLLDSNYFKFLKYKELFSVFLNL